MPNFKEVVISKEGDAVRMTRVDIPDYVQRAIEDSLERGKRDAERQPSKVFAANAGA